MIAVCLLTAVIWQAEPLIVNGVSFNTVYANFTIHYNFVASDEIVVLQNAIEDMQKIVNMSVQKISMESKDVLPSPINVTAEAISATQIRVNWTKVDTILNINGTDYGVKGYTVFCKLYGTNDWKRFATNYTERSLTIDDLLPYTLYTIRMLAYHDGGNGISSEYQDIKTAEGGTHYNVRLISNPQWPD